MTLSIDIHDNSIACRCAECHDYLNSMLSVIMIAVVGLNVVILSVVAPWIVTPVTKVDSQFDKAGITHDFLRIH